MADISIGRSALLPGKRDLSKDVPIVQVLEFPVMFAFAAAGVCAQYPASLLLRVLGWPTWWSWIAFGVAVLAALAWGSGRGLHGTVWGLRGPKRTLPKAAEATARLRVGCPERMAHRFENLSKEPFEPRVFQLFLALPDRRKTALWMFALSACVVFAALVWIERMLGIVNMAPPFKFWAAMTFAALPMAVAWPTYLRIAPGRMDVFRYGFLGRGRPRVVSFDVRRERLDIDLRTNAIRIGRGEGVLPRAVHFGMLCPYRAEIARAVLEAAVSEHPSPPLPEDALVG